MAYIDELKASVGQDAQLKKEQEQELKEADDWHLAMRPLDQRLKSLLDDIPDQVKVDGLSLPVLQRMLKGRRRGSCHPGELGTALRKLGYKRQRKWKGVQEGFVSTWKRPKCDSLL